MSLRQADGKSASRRRQTHPWVPPGVRGGARTGTARHGAVAFGQLVSTSATSQPSSVSLGLPHRRDCWPPFGDRLAERGRRRTWHEVGHRYPNRWRCIAAVIAPASGSAAMPAPIGHSPAPRQGTDQTASRRRGSPGPWCRRGRPPGANLGPVVEHDHAIEAPSQHASELGTGSGHGECGQGPGLPARQSRRSLPPPRWSQQPGGVSESGHAAVSCGMRAAVGGPPSTLPDANTIADRRLKPSLTAAN